MSLLTIFKEPQEGEESDLTVSAKIQINKLPEELTSVLQEISTVLTTGKALSISAIRTAVEFDKLNSLEEPLITKLISVMSDVELEDILDTSCNEGIFAYTVFAFFPVLTDESAVDINITSLTLSEKAINFNVTISPLSDEDHNELNELHKAREATWAKWREERAAKEEKLTNDVIETIYSLAKISEHGIDLEAFTAEFKSMMGKDELFPGFNSISNSTGRIISRIKARTQ